jgi:hypothetical protein
VREGRIVIVKSGFLAGEWTRAIMRSLLDEAVSAQASRTPGMGLRIVIDEAHSLLGTDRPVVDLLDRASKIDYGLIACVQFVEQLEPGVREQLRRTVRNNVSFVLDPSLSEGRVGEIDQGQRVLEATDMLRLPMGVAYANVASSSEPSRAAGSGPFTLAIDPLVELAPGAAMLARQVLEARMKAFHV